MIELVEPLAATACQDQYRNRIIHIPSRAKYSKVEEETEKKNKTEQCAGILVGKTERERGRPSVFLVDMPICMTLALLLMGLCIQKLKYITGDVMMSNCIDLKAAGTFHFHPEHVAAVLYAFPDCFDWLHFVCKTVICVSLFVSHMVEKQFNFRVLMSRTLYLSLGGFSVFSSFVRWRLISFRKCANPPVFEPDGSIYIHISFSFFLFLKVGLSFLSLAF